VEKNKGAIRTRAWPGKQHLKIIKKKKDYFHKPTKKKECFFKKAKRFKSTQKNKRGGQGEAKPGDLNDLLFEAGGGGRS